MKVTAFDGSPRKTGNSTLLLNAFLSGCAEKEAEIELFKTDDLDINSCRGCLMCNTLKKCAIRKDGWQQLSEKILESDVLVFATPIYFHHTTASMKKLIDRFRSFINVQITEDGLKHTPHQEWRKKFYLLTAHGSSSVEEAAPLVELFRFMAETLGPENSFEYLNAVRLVVSGQLEYPAERLELLYEKLSLDKTLAEQDAKRNLKYISAAEEMGRMI